jgi:hypothetical protein
VGSEGLALITVLDEPNVLSKQTFLREHCEAKCATQSNVSIKPCIEIVRDHRVPSGHARATRESPFRSSFA